MINRVRYVERKYLCKYDLTEEFFNEIGIEVLEAIPLRKLFILQTSNGKKVLKRVDYDKERIEFIINALKYIENGFENVISFNKFKNEESYFIWKDKLYIMMDVLKGREVTFTNDIEVQLCIQAISKYHKSGVGIKGYLEKVLTKEIKINDIDNEYVEGLSELLNIHSIISEYKNLNDFDKIVINENASLVKEIKDSINWIKNNVDFKSLRDDEEAIVLCHNDLAHHNFLIEEGIIALLDFDCCSINYRVIDLANFLIKSIKNVAFDIDKGMKVIDLYNDSMKLSKNELNLLYGILMFPREVYSIIKSYYYKGKEWDEEVFLSRLKFKVENDIFRREFCEEFKKKYI